MNIIQKIIKKALYYPMPIQLRLYLLRKTGASIGKGSVILSGCNINVSQLIIGDNTWIGKNCYIWASTTESSSVHIGNNVMIAHLVNICCVTHQVGTNQKRAGKTIYI